MEVVVASSSVDGSIGCWDLPTGAEKLRYKSCASPTHGLVSVGQRFLASSQLSNPSSSTGSILYWAWSKTQVDVKSFPAEPIMPVAANTEGTYIVGGGLSGDIYLWEVVSGRMLKKWHAHYGAVTCLVFSEDDSLLVSGSADGCVRVWSLLMIFDDVRQQEADHLFQHSFNGHSLRVTDIVIGHGGSKAIIVSASDDQTCKVWSLSKGTLLKDTLYPSPIHAIALDPGERVLYAGGRDGWIYVSALNTESTSISNHGLDIISSIQSHGKALTCLAYGISENWLISGSEDGIIRFWDTRTCKLVRSLKHAKGPVSNILVVTLPQPDPNSQAISRRHGSLLSPPLAKYENSTEEDAESKSVTGLSIACPESEPMSSSYISSHTINNQIIELQKQGSAAAVEMDVERVKGDCKRARQQIQHWRKLYQKLQKFCVEELLDDEQSRIFNGNST